MNILSRILSGFRSAFQWDNPIEILIDYHIFRRNDPIRLLHCGHPIIVNYRHSDMQAARDVLLKGMYDQAFNHAFENMSKNETFRYLNLGANIGAFDIRALQFGKQHGIFVVGTAVEMNPAAFSRLVVQLDINRLYSVRAVNAAVWNQRGEVLVSVAARDTGQNCESTPTGWPVPMRPWNEIFAEASKGEPIFRPYIFLPSSFAPFADFA